MPSPKIIQLRQAVAERFPHARPHWDRPGASRQGGWVTGLPQLEDTQGFPKGALTELCLHHKSAGGATVLRALIERAAREHRIIAFVDGSDSLDVTQIDPTVLARLLWVRARAADEAIKAADLVLRDQNLGFVIIDLAFNEPTQLRRIPATVWYRFQRLLENTATICVVTTPQHIVLPAQIRLDLPGRFSLAQLENEGSSVLAQVGVEVVENVSASEMSQHIA
jgi:hypothetical protein